MAVGGPRILARPTAARKTDPCADSLVPVRCRALSARHSLGGEIGQFRRYCVISLTYRDLAIWRANRDTGGDSRRQQQRRDDVAADR